MTPVAEESVQEAEPIAIGEYEQKAKDFLSRFGIAFSAVPVKGWECPPRCDKQDEDIDRHNHGLCYTITLAQTKGLRRMGARKRKSLAFPFWASAKNYEEGRAVAEYDVLSCLSSEITTPNKFEEFCSEFGYDPDSRKVYATWEDAHDLACRLRAFFTAAQQEALKDIQ